MGGAGLFWGRGAVCGVAGAPVNQKTQPPFNEREKVGGKTRPPPPQQLWAPLNPWPGPPKTPKRGWRPTRTAPTSQQCPLPVAHPSLPSPPLTGEALEDVAVGAAGGDEGPEARAEGDDEDGDQAGLVPGVQERLGDGESRVRNVTACQPPPQNSRGGERGGSERSRALGSPA